MERPWLGKSACMCAGGMRDKEVMGPQMADKKRQPRIRITSSVSDESGRVGRENGAVSRAYK